MQVAFLINNLLVDELEQILNLLLEWVLEVILVRSAGCHSRVAQLVQEVLRVNTPSSTVELLDKLCINLGDSSVVNNNILKVHGRHSSLVLLEVSVALEDAS